MKLEPREPKIPARTAKAKKRNGALKGQNTAGDLYEKDGWFWAGNFRVCKPIDVLARGSANENGEKDNWGKVVEFKNPDGDSVRVFLLSKEIGKEACLDRLRDKGFEVMPTQEKHLTTFLTEASPDARVEVVESTGWRGNFFVLPDKVVGKGESNLVFIGRGTSPISTKGSTDDWRDNIGKLCKSNPKAIVAVNHALAAILGEPVGRRLLGINFNGDSSKGKTTLLKLAASVVGSPNYLLSWSSTANGLAAKAMHYNDLPMILDELGQKDAKDAGAAMYALYNGIEKQRAGRDGNAKEAKRFRVGVVSSGEVDLAAKIQEAGGKMKSGQEIRLVDIEADAGAGQGVFNEVHGFDGGAALSKAIGARVTEFYGSTALAFIEKIAATDHKELAAQFALFESTFRQRLLPPGAAEAVGRVADSFALNAFAGELATQWGLTGWDIGEAQEAAAECFKGWMTTRGSTTESAEEESFVITLRDFIDKHKLSRFCSLEADPKGARINNLAGYIDGFDDGEIIYFTGAGWGECFSGMDKKRAAARLEELGVLQRAESKHLKNHGTKHVYTVLPYRLYR